MPLTATATGVASVRDRMASAGLAFPVVAKPDLGWCGFGVRKLDDEAGLTRYLREFPRDESLVLQRWLPGTGEAGLFYLRDPVSERGELSIDADAPSGDEIFASAARSVSSLGEYFLESFRHSGRIITALPPVA